MAEGDRVVGPLQGFRGRVGAGLNHARPWLPELNVVVGRDTDSSGLTVTVWEDAGGSTPRVRTLYSARWAKPITSAQEALEICIRGVSAALAELLDSQE